MKLRNLLVPIALLAAMAFGGTYALAKEPPADGGKTLLTDGLLQPRGIKASPDGMLYVAESGTGGTTKAIGGEAGTVYTGNTGRISKIDPATGTRTTVLDGIPSAWGGNPNDDPSSFGIADIAFLDNTLYYLSTGGEKTFPGHPAGIYKVTINRDPASNTAKLVANIGAFTAANPTIAVKNGTQEDVDPEGNPYSMIVRGRSFYVVDGNQNQVIQVTEGGAISRLADFGEHVVSTGNASKDDGPLFVSTIGQGPFLPQDGRVFQVGFPTGNIIKIAGGVSFLTGLAFGPGGQLYAQSFAEPADDPNGPPFKFGTGGIFKVNDDGTLSAVITGFTAGTTFTFIGDTAYALNDSVNAFGTGEIWKIANFSSIVPQSPAAAMASSSRHIPTRTRPSVTGRTWCLLPNCRV